MSLDVNALWDFGDPLLSERRFREELLHSGPDERLIIETQIARTFGIRGEFDQARDVLKSIKPALGTASSEAYTRYWLEFGRSFCSTAHPPECQTKEAKQTAREAFGTAFDLANAGGLDWLAIDALHMMTTVDTSTEAQIEWNRKALTYMEASKQADAKAWEGSLRHNLGYALFLAERHEEALVEFELSRLARQRSGKIEGERIARWMIARTFRALNRLTEAIEIQTSLEMEWKEAQSPSRYVFQELEILYRALGNLELAEHYKELQVSLA